MKINKNFGIIAAIGLGVAAMFQNCSPAQFTRKPAATVAAVATPGAPPVVLDPVAFEVTPASLLFGSLPVATAEDNKLITIIKDDSRSITFDKISFEGVDAGLYSIDTKDLTNACELQESNKAYTGTLVQNECQFRVIYRPPVGTIAKKTVLNIQAGEKSKSIEVFGGRLNIVVDDGGTTVIPPKEFAPTCFFRNGNENGWDYLSHWDNKLNVQPAKDGEGSFVISPYFYTRPYKFVGANGKQCWIPDVMYDLERTLTAGGYYDGTWKPQAKDIVTPPVPGTPYNGTGKYHITCKYEYFPGIEGTNGLDHAGNVVFMTIDGTCE